MIPERRPGRCRTSSTGGALPGSFAVFVDGRRSIGNVAVEGSRRKVVLLGQRESPRSCDAYFFTSCAVPCFNRNDYVRSALICSEQPSPPPPGNRRRCRCRDKLDSPRSPCWAVPTSKRSPSSGSSSLQFRTGLWAYYSSRQRRRDSLPTWWRLSLSTSLARPKPLTCIAGCTFLRLPVI